MAHTALQAATYPLGHETLVPSTRLERVTCSFGGSHATQLRHEDLRAAARPAGWIFPDVYRPRMLLEFKVAGTAIWTKGASS